MELRREWDSNPRYGFPHTRFPSVRLKPLGHLSGAPLLKGQEGFCKGAEPDGCDIYSIYWCSCCFRLVTSHDSPPPAVLLILICREPSTDLRRRSPLDKNPP